MKWVNGGQGYNPLQQMMLDTGLRDAVINGDSPLVVRGWIDRGAKVNPDPGPEASGYQPTPLLHIAARDGRSTVIEVLAGADRNGLDVRDMHGRNALHVASLEGQAASAHVLMQMGLDAQAKDEYGFSPVDLAMARGHGTILDIMRSNGVECAEQDVGALRAQVAEVYPLRQRSHAQRQQQRRNDGPQFPIR